jgi:dipeptidase E
LVDFGIIPHYSNPAFQDTCGANAEKWAQRLPNAVYAISENAAIKCVEGKVGIIAEGEWKLFENAPEA